METILRIGKFLPRYLVRMLELWVIWFWFFALAALGLVIDTFVPAFSPPRWVYWALIPGIGFLVANVRLFAECEVEKRLLQNRIDELQHDLIGEDSIVLSLHPRPFHNIAEMQYIGKEPIKDVNVWLVHTDRDGNRKRVKVEQFFSLTDHLVAGHHVNASFLKPGEGRRFHLPQKDKVEGGEVAVEISFVGAKTSRSVNFEGRLKLKA